VIIYNYFFGDSYISNDVIWFQSKILFYSLFNFLLGFFIYEKLYDKEFSKIIFIVWFIFVAILFYNISNFSLDTHGLYGLHLLFGDIFILLSIIVIFLNITNKYLKILLFTLVLFLLYIIQSRASLYSFFIFYLIFLLKELRIRNFVFIIVTVSTTAVILYNIDLISFNNRMLGAVIGNKDYSLNERLEQFIYGIEAIQNNWFFGEFGGQIIRHNTAYMSGNMGCYMHNWLSYWRQFGIVFFLIFTLSYLYGIYYIFSIWLKKDKAIVNILFYLSLFIGVELLIFRSYGDTLVWFVIALLYLYIYNDKKGVLL
jgi:hypothetical protein